MHETTALEPSQVKESAAAPRGEDLIHLRDITPAGSEAILAALSDGRGVRLAYDPEFRVLELMAPGLEHEGDSRIIDLLFHEIAIERNVEVESRGSLTLKLHAEWVEPDSCFYIGAHAIAIRGKKKLDLVSDPPPDVAVEIDISRARMDKGKLYAALGVPELWQYKGSELRFYELAGGKYTQTAASRTFPWLSAADVQRFVDMSAVAGQSATIRAFRAWLRAEPTR